tara:strand:+ start:284 stop:508 length:225 start_codon:yes stop_codon:yes gene_type:complete
MIGYKYTTEKLAIAARKQCADYYGLPKTPTSSTIYKVNYSVADLNTPKFWYIKFDKSIKEVLGEPIEFNIITEI